MVRKFDLACTIEPDIWDIKYINRDYIPALYPRFTVYQVRKMEKDKDNKIRKALTIKIE